MRNQVFVSKIEKKNH